MLLVKSGKEQRCFYYSGNKSVLLLPLYYISQPFLYKKNCQVSGQDIRISTKVIIYHCSLRIVIHYVLLKILKCSLKRQTENDSLIKVVLICKKCKKL